VQLVQQACTSATVKFDDQSVTWQDQYRLTVPQLELLRQTGIQSFGSCSFDEPVADLQKLGIL